MIIRKATQDDIPALLDLLLQVLKIHAAIRPDVFLPEGTKYTAEELHALLEDPGYFTYVAVIDETVVGYAFCQYVTPKFTNTMRPVHNFYLDDLCVDEKCRGQHIGESLFQYVVEEAKRLGCEEVVLSCWEGNDAAAKFYKKMGLKVRNTTMELILK